MAPSAGAGESPEHDSQAARTFDVGRLPFPFILGAGRSGTTLLRLMLDSHPQLAVPDEVGFGVVAPYFSHGRANWAGAFDRLAARIETKWEMTPDELRPALAAAGPATAADFQRCLLQQYATAHGKARYGYKFPGASEQLRSIARSLPEARFIHLVRDGRQAVRSLQRAPFGPTTTLTCADEWNRRTRGALAGRDLGPDRYLEIRYEDLVRDTPTVLRTICDLIHLDYDPAMIDETRREQALGKVPANDRLAERPELRPDQDLGSPAAERDFAIVAGDLQRALGYPLPAVEITPGRRIAARARLLIARAGDRATLLRRRARQRWRLASARGRA